MIRTVSVAFVFIMLAGCAAEGLRDRQAVASYPSSKSRDQVTDCLLNRLSDSVQRPHLTRGATENQLVIKSAFGNPVMDFVIRDQGAGSITEFRRASSITSGKSAAETCF